MDALDIPTTEAGLESWMKAHFFNFSGYSINGNHVYEGFGIEQSGGLFIWYYTERGQKDRLKSFGSEAEVVAYAFHQIRHDTWAKTHCIGFSADAALISDLKDKLQAMNIAFFEDSIPYYGWERPVYRVFVSGCDIQKTAHLTEIYRTES